MPLFTPGVTYKYSAKTGKFRAKGGKANKRARVVANTSENRRRMKSLNTMLGTMGAKSRMRLAKRGAARRNSMKRGRQRRAA